MTIDLASTKELIIEQSPRGKNMNNCEQKLTLYECLKCHGMKYHFDLWHGEWVCTSCVETLSNPLKQS